MEGYPLPLLATLFIWIIVTFLIVFRAVIDPTYRKKHIRMSLIKVLLLGIFWPLVIVGIVAYAFYILTLCRLRHD